ncbi:MAG TPA: hemerythrin domain-containing protein [Burkholderiales bacterium]|nr:hemerythrin domain-containing protein [Burkholderiales bacterium]
MNSALNIIRNEHRSLAAILHALRALVEGIRDGSSRSDFDGLRTMLYYLDAFSSRLHHPQEDEFLFQPLRACGGEAVEIIDDLEDEHARGAAAMRSLEQALLRYEAGGKREFVAFATAVEGFCDFYFQHMHKEETLAMPLAEKLFSAREWAKIDAAWAAAHEAGGAVEEDREFRNLCSRILARVPAQPAHRRRRGDGGPEAPNAA